LNDIKFSHKSQSTDFLADLQMLPNKLLKVKNSIFENGQNGFWKISKFEPDPKISKISHGLEFTEKVQKLVNFSIQILTLEPSYKSNEILLNSKRSHHLLLNSDIYI
jgi:hypothetical protein